MDHPVSVSLLRDCARCGKDHKNLLFVPLTNAADEWKWWCMCPIIQEPILLALSEDDA